ncbi:protein Gemin2 [Euwallacea similis]|uniref:protein Gemin2 n=1 Tax=Euwallacea similis TaxID=1736056 RepID=UPI00344C720B
MDQMEDLTESSGDEYTGILKKFVDVQIPDDFDPNSVPQTGEEYLQHVIYERNKKCPKCVKADIDISKYRSNQTVFSYQYPGLPVALEKFYPTKTWRDKALYDFNQFRNFLANTVTRDEADQVFSAETFRQRLKDLSHPTFSELTSYSQASKIFMLDLINNHLQDFDAATGITEALGVWIYGILALLEMPLTPDCYVKIRNFAITCGNIRSTFSEDVSKHIATPLNLYIAIITTVYNQQDIADNI